MGVDRHDVCTRRSKVGIKDRGDGHIQPRILRHLAIFRVVERAFDIVERWSQMDAPRQKPRLVRGHAPKSRKRGEREVYFGERSGRPVVPDLHQEVRRQVHRVHEAKECGLRIHGGHDRGRRDLLPARDDPNHLLVLHDDPLDGGIRPNIGACVSRASRQRRLVWRYLRWLTNLDIADLTSGYRAYSRRAIAVAASWPATSFDYQDVGLLLLLRRRGMRIVESEVTMSPRRDGKSRIFSSWFQVARYVAFSSMHGWSKRADGRAPARLPGSSRA